MNISYDEQADALYVRVSGAIVSRTRTLDTGTMVDLDAHGFLVGIEVLQPARRWLVTVLDGYGDQVPDSDRALLEQLFGDDDSKSFSFAPLLEAVG